MGKNYKYSPPSSYNSQNEEVKLIEFDDILEEIFLEMELSGKSSRTIQSYKYHFNSFIEVSDLTLPVFMTRTDLMKYIGHGKVSNNTKNIRLKHVRPILKEMFKRGYINEIFWEGIKISTTKDVRSESSTEDIQILLSNLDKDDYVEFRDYVYINLVYQTGIRSGTMSHVTFDMFDFRENLLTLPAQIMKGKIGSVKPIPDNFEEMITRLHIWNQDVLKATEKDTPNLFLTTNGLPFEHPDTKQSNIVKRLNKYNKRFNIHVTAHGIRSNFATQLVNNGVNLTTIQNALDHQSLETTQRYLDIDSKAKTDEMREFLNKR